jgi:hypothetical protein
MTPDRRAQWKQLAERALPGPWTAGPENGELAGDPDDPWVVFGLSFWVSISSNDTKADAEFIAAARTAVPELLDALEAAEAEIAKLRARVDLWEPTP